MCSCYLYSFVSTGIACTRIFPSIKHQRIVMYSIHYLMDVLIVLFLSFFVFVNTQASDVIYCPTIKCSDDSPVIQFPFRARELQFPYCGLPGFEISCKQNKSIIHFRSYGGLEVKSISYESKSIRLLDPNSCVHEVFLNLDLSGTPYKYYYVLKEYTYLNCSAKLPIPFTRVPCLSAPGYHVYIVEPSTCIPDSCIPLKSIGIPFPYSPYLSDNTFGLRLTWDTTGQENNEVRGLHSGFDQSETGSMNDIGIFIRGLRSIIFLFMVVALVFSKTCYVKNDEENKEQKQPNAIEARRLLRDCDTPELPRHSKASIKVTIDQGPTSAHEKCETPHH